MRRGGIWRFFRFYLSNEIFLIVVKNVFCKLFVGISRLLGEKLGEWG